MEERRVLDRDFAHEGRLACNLDRLGRVVLGQAIVQVPRRARVANVEQKVVEDDLLVVRAVGLARLLVKGDDLARLAEKEAAKKGQDAEVKCQTSRIEGLFTVEGGRTP